MHDLCPLLPLARQTSARTLVAHSAKRLHIFKATFPTTLRNRNNVISVPCAPFMRCVCKLVKETWVTPVARIKAENHIMSCTLLVHLQGSDKSMTIPFASAAHTALNPKKIFAETARLYSVSVAHCTFVAAKEITNALRRIVTPVPRKIGTTHVAEPLSICAINGLFAKISSSMRNECVSDFAIFRRRCQELFRG